MIPEVQRELESIKKSTLNTKLSALIELLLTPAGIKAYNGSKYVSDLVCKLLRTRTIFPNELSLVEYKILSFNKERFDLEQLTCLINSVTNYDLRLKLEHLRVKVLMNKPITADNKRLIKEAEESLTQIFQPPVESVSMIDHTQEKLAPKFERKKKIKEMGKKIKEALDNRQPVLIIVDQNKQDITKAENPDKEEVVKKEENRSKKIDSFGDNTEDFKSKLFNNTDLTL